MLSVIIPAYNEEECIKSAYNVIYSLLAENNIESEFVFIDDGSYDQTYKMITELASEKENVSGLHFSRNFGKESAISAGLAAANGDAAVVIDCDLQHPPEKIIEMYRLWEQGYEIVEGIKKERGQEKKMHSMGAKIFYSVISRMAGFDTKILVEAFDEEGEEMKQSETKKVPEPIPAPEPQGDNDLQSALGEKYEFLLAALDGDKDRQKQVAKRLSAMPDAIADEINEAAAELLGDIILEEGDDGDYRVIEDYREVVK